MASSNLVVATTCVCGDTVATVFGEKNGHQVGRCACGIMRTLTRAADYATLYTAGDAYHVEQQIADGHPPYVLRLEADVRLGRQRLRRLGSRFRLLDVGCANGGFLKAARESFGYEAEGLEPNPEMAAFATKVSGCPVATSWGDVRGWFDIITYHDVFEHVVDPVAELAQVYGHMYEGGRLVLDVPDHGDPRAQNPDMSYHHWRPEQHLWHWDEATLTRVLRQAGFGVDHVERPIPGKLVVYAGA